MAQAPFQRTVKSVLMTNRLIWAALILGQVMFAVVLSIVLQQPPAHLHNAIPALVYVCIAVAAAAIPAAMVARSVVWNRSRRENGFVRVGPYATGTIIYLALCEGASFLSLVTCLVNWTLAPTIYVAAVCVVFQLFAFPTDAPLRKQDGTFGDDFPADAV